MRLTGGPALPLLASTGDAVMHDTVPTSHSGIGSAGPRGQHRPVRPCRGPGKVYTYVTLAPEVVWQKCSLKFLIISLLFFKFIF